MKKTVKDYDLNNKKVIIRCDFNVPLKDGKIVDDNRIKESLETINYCINENAKLILLSHLGRIKSEEDLSKNSLKQIAVRLSELLKRPVTFIPKTRGKELEDAISNMKPKDVIMLENTRFEDLEDKKESSTGIELGKYWASLGDIFINDAFGTIHRSHASNVGIASNLPNGIGFLVEKELKYLSKLNDPSRPYVVILGGAKVSDKLGVINNLVTKADFIIIGGAMAFTFLKAIGYEVGKSLVEEDLIPNCKDLLNKYGEKIILPKDIVTSTEISENSISQNKDISEMNESDIGLDLRINSKMCQNSNVEWSTWLL